MSNTVRIIGLDPGLNHTGWGIIDASGNALHYIACGRITTAAKTDTMGERLTTLYNALNIIIETHQPSEAAVEETFMNKNALSALKLGMARGVVMLAPAYAGLSVAEYSATLVKKSISGYGHADKDQVTQMVKMLLPAAELESPDAADALAIAVCHAHHRASNALLKGLRA
ncbi:MAG: crossover junction endodeoxyribonuclease RuvC [Alphaproteobacteria bacterium]|nr:crossover junction endodeoxyribonuclease RuvC [Alphaproteobacteria bacterium]